jgi:hypothetical protein
MPVSLVYAGEQSLVRVHPDARLDGHVAEQPRAQLGIADGTWVAQLCGLMDQVGAELTHDIPLFGGRRAGGSAVSALRQRQASRAPLRPGFVRGRHYKARGPAAALAARLGAPVLDSQALQVLTAEDALAGLPDTALTIPASLSDDMTVGLTFNAWVRVHDVDHLGVMAVMTDGMRRFGLPELRMGPASPDLREELTALLNGVAFRIWSDLLARAHDTPNAAGLVNLPRFLRVSAEMDIHRRDLDRASGVPNRGGTFAMIGLRFDPAQGEDSGGWLTVCPPPSWDTSWEDFIADTCHGMFGFEKPRWHYMPEFGALLDALDRARQTLPETRSRFLRGDLPPGGRLMVRYGTADTDEFQWARVESWKDSRHAVVREIGGNLRPGCGRVLW